MSTRRILPEASLKNQLPTAWVERTDTALNSTYSVPEVSIGDGVIDVNLNSTDDEVTVFGQSTDGNRYPFALTSLGELKIVSTAGAGSTQVSVQNVAGTTLSVQLSSLSSATVFQGTSPWVVGGNTTAILTTASKSQVEPVAGAVFPISGNTTAILTTASTVSAIVTPAAGTTFTVRPAGTPNGEFTLPTGTTVLQGVAHKATSAAGSTVLVSSGAGSIRVLSYVIQMVDTASTLNQGLSFLSSNATFQAPEFLFGPREGANLSAPAGGFLFETATGCALNMVPTTNAKISVFVDYIRTT